jgi:sigma-E factor negative regulatory protein RseC
LERFVYSIFFRTAILTTEEGIVIKTGSDRAWVRTTKSVACSACASKNSCTAIGEDREVEAINSAGAQTGDRIVLSLKTSSILKVTFLLYVFPVLCMIIGAVTGQNIARHYNLDASAVSAIFGFLFLIPSFLFIRSRGKKLAEKNRYKPKITRIIKPADNRKAALEP